MYGQLLHNATAFAAQVASLCREVQDSRAGPRREMYKTGDEGNNVISIV